MTHILCINPTQPHLTRRELIADLHIWARMVVNNGGLDRWLYMIDGVQFFPYVTGDESDFVNSINFLKGKTLFAEVKIEGGYECVIEGCTFTPIKLLKPEDFVREHDRRHTLNHSGKFYAFSGMYDSLEVYECGEYVTTYKCLTLQEACDIVNKDLSNED